MKPLYSSYWENPQGENITPTLNQEELNNIGTIEELFRYLFECGIDPNFIFSVYNFYNGSGVESLRGMEDYHNRKTIRLVVDTVMRIMEPLGENRVLPNSVMEKITERIFEKINVD